MIVVAILGILAAIAIPAFVTYVRRAKTTEASEQLKTLFNGAASYYAKEFTGSGLSASTQAHCTVSTQSTTNSPGPSKSNVDYGSLESFKQLGTTPQNIYYQYTITANTAQCNNPISTSLYTMTARGDLDGDGVLSQFDLAVGSSADNELYHARGIYIVNEIE
jgi:type IV pilus assembly protein PilA